MIQKITSLIKYQFFANKLFIFYLKRLKKYLDFYNFLCVSISPSLLLNFENYFKRTKELKIIFMLKSLS